jgi:hypothetical protein
VAIAAEALAGAINRAPRAANRVYNALPASGSQPATQVVTRLIWALAIGLVVLEVAAQTTGQTWGWSLQGLGRQPPAQVPYQALDAPTPAATVADLAAQNAALIGLHGTEAPPQRRDPSLSGPGPRL